MSFSPITWCLNPTRAYFKGESKTISLLLLDLFTDLYNSEIMRRRV